MNVKPIVLLEDSVFFGYFLGQVLPGENRIWITCPECGERYALQIPPFTWDPAKKSIGPASIALNAPDCGWHGYLHDGEWRGDTPCKGKPGEKLFTLPGVTA